MKKAKAKKHTTGQSMRTLFLFLITVFLLIVVSLAVKFADIVKHSKFTRQHQFTVAIIISDKQAEIVSISPTSRSVSHLTIMAKDKLPEDSTFGIPVDGKIMLQNVSLTGTDLPSKLTRLTKNYYRIRSDITILDLLQVTLFTRSVSTKNVKEASVTLPLPDAAGEELSSFFYDPEIVDEDVPIGIVNASGVSGLGGKIEWVLSNIGCNVLSVSTSPKVQAESKIFYFGEPSYTLSRIQKSLKLPIEKMSEKGLSDIIIQLGVDKKTVTIY